MTTQYNRNQHNITGLNAIELCTKLSGHPILETLYHDLPNDFIVQALLGKKKFELTYDMVKEDIIRIVLHEPRLVRDGLMSIKFQLKGIVKKGELVPMGKPLGKGQSYLSGFNSLNILVTEDLFSAIDWELLCRYEQWWASQDSTVIYKKGLATRRLYLSAANAKFLFQFNLDVRSRLDGSLCLGIANDIAMREIKLLDFVGLPVNVVSEAKAQRTGSQLIASAAAITLPVRD